MAPPIGRLQQGVRFVGTNYGDDRVSIDLTRDGVPGISPHKVTDVDGKVRQSTCPVGDLRISAYRARVILTLPQGCSFAFGKRSDGYRFYRRPVYDHQKPVGIRFPASGQHVLGPFR